MFDISLQGCITCITMCVVLLVIIITRKGESIPDINKWEVSLISGPINASERVAFIVQHCTSNSDVYPWYFYLQYPAEQYPSI